MRTMKRVAAVALSVVVLMTSGVSAKAAVTDVQPAKSSSEAVLKWQWPEKRKWTSVSNNIRFENRWKICLFSK